MLKKHEKLNKVEKIAIGSKIEHILADFCYDRDAIPCDCLKEMALFLYKYSDLGPKRTDKIALCFYKVSNIIGDLEAKNIKLHFLNEKGQYISLAEIERRSKLPYYTNVYYDITKLIQKTLQENTINLGRLDSSVFITCINMAQKLVNENNKELNQDFQNIYKTDIANYVSASTPEERYRHLKVVRSFLKNYSESIKELSLEDEANILIDQLEKLRETLNIKTEKIEEIRHIIFQIDEAVIEEDEVLLRQRLLTGENFLNQYKR